MWKKALLIGIVGASLLVAALVGYKQIKARTLLESIDLYIAISPQAGVVIETRNFANFSKAVLYGNDISGEIRDFDFIRKLYYLLENADMMFTKHLELQVIANRDVLISFQPSDGERSQANLFAVRATRQEASRLTELIRENIFPEKQLELTRYRGNTIHLFPDNTTGRNRLACAHVNGIFLISSTLEEIQSAINRIDGEAENLSQDSTFLTIRSTAGRRALGNIFVQTSEVFPLLAGKISDSRTLLTSKINSFPDWLGLDIHLSSEQILLNGYSTASNDFLKTVFIDQEPVRGELFYKLPLNTVFFTHYGISNYNLFVESTGIEQRFRQNVSFMRNHFDGELITAFTSRASSLQEGSFVTFSIRDSILLAEQLEGKSELISQFSAYSFQRINVYKLPQEYSLTAAFGDFANINCEEFVVILGNKVLVSSSVELTTELAGLVMSGFTLAKDNTFLQTARNFDSRSNVLSYVHFPALLSFAENIFTSSVAERLVSSREQLSEIKTIGWQMGSDRGLIYHNAFARTGQADSILIEMPVRRTNRLIWAVSFDGQPVFGPVIVKNRRTGTEEILLQDENYVLHFYTHSGQREWYLQLDGPILGNEMQQIDFFRNNRYQFLFNTAQKLYLVDRQGRTVERYPIRLPSQASAALAVFDYDNNRDYRIFVPSVNRNIYLFRKDGTRPPDWQFRQTQRVMTLPLQHFRVDGRDHLIVNDGQQIRILDRRGRDRVNLRTPFEASNNPLHFLARSQGDRPAFITTDRQGQIKRIFLDGTVSTTKVSDELTSAHSFMMTQIAQNPLFIFLEGNRLLIFNHEHQNVFEKHFEGDKLRANLKNRWLTVYSPEAEMAKIFDLSNLNAAGQFFPSNVEPTVGTLNPMPQTYVLIINDGKILCFELN